jgi:hypothetical protein
MAVTTSGTSILVFSGKSDELSSISAAMPAAAIPTLQTMARIAKQVGRFMRNLLFLWEQLPSGSFWPDGVLLVG